jgi:hypothetical protein
LLPELAVLAELQATKNDAGSSRLRTQPWCRDCRQARRQRRKLARALCAEFGVEFRLVDAGAKQVVLGCRDKKHPAILNAEAFAYAGLTVVDQRKHGVPGLPANPADAMRVVYASLTSDNRRGALEEREILLQAIPTLAAQLGDAHPLVSYLTPSGKIAELHGRARDVIDVALVREGIGDRANDAMNRIIDRVWRRHAREMFTMVNNNAYGSVATKDGRAAAEEEGRSRVRRGITWAILGMGRQQIDNAQRWVEDVQDVRSRKARWWKEVKYGGCPDKSWDPLHPRGARLSTMVYQRVKRNLQVRANHDHPIGAFKTSKNGPRLSPAASLDAMRTTEESGFVPHVARVSDGGAVQSPHAAADDVNTSRAVDMDLQRALSALTDDQRELALRHFANGEGLVSLAERFDSTVAEVKRRIAAVKGLLGWLLADYAEVS